MKMSVIFAFKHREGHKENFLRIVKDGHNDKIYIKPKLRIDEHDDEIHFHALLVVLHLS